MANNYSEILALANKNNMGLSNTIKRDYGIPLDYSSVQETYEAALAYVKTSTLAYIGQPISVGDTLYIVTDEAGGYLKAVGTKPTGDGKSIVVGEDGKVSMYGFEAAAGATLPQKQQDGTIVWKAIDAIVSGDGNEKTRVVAADGSDITVTEVYNSENDTYTYTLDVDFPAIPEYSVTKEEGTDAITYQLTKDDVAVGEAIVVPKAYDDTALAERVADAEAAITEHDGRIADVEERVETFFGAVENPDEVIDTLAEIQKYITDDKTGAAGMLEDIKANADAIEALNGEGAGSVKAKIDAAVADQTAFNAATYATQDALAAVSTKANDAAVKTEVEAALAEKADSTDLENYYKKTETYTKQEIGALLDGVTGGSQETAASVKRQLDDHIADNTAAFSDIDKKNGEQDIAIQSNANEIAAIKDETTGILAQAKADAQSKITALANGKVAENTAAIAAANSSIDAVNDKVTNTNANVDNLTQRVGNLEQADTNIGNRVAAVEGAHEALNTAVAGHTTAIQALQDKDATIEAAVTANTNKFADYSTTAQVTKAIDDKIAAIDYTGLEEGIAANTKAISDEVTRAKAREDEIAGDVADNAEAIAANASEIARVDNVLKAALENNGEGIDSIKELATWITEHESEVLPAIQDNADEIAILKGTGEGSVKKAIDDAIAAIPDIPFATALEAGLVRASEEVTVDRDGTLGIGFVSTDKLVQGKDTLVLNGGKAVAASN